MRRWLSGACASGLLVVASAVQAPAAVDWRVAIDRAIRHAVVEGRLPGAVVLVGQGDRVLYREAIGFRALRPSAEPMTVDTVFDLASLTKVVATAPAVLALVEAGRLDLDAPVGRYLEELGGDRLRDVTPRRLLTHSAGAPALGPLEGEVAAGDVLRRLAVSWPDPTPEPVFRYSDAGFVVLGELVRRVSGEDLDAFAARRIFQPLGLRATRFRPPAAWRGRIAPTEVEGGEPLRGLVHDRLARALGGIAGHAGLFATADDLARFSQMLLAGGALDGQRILQAATVQAMFAPHRLGETVRGLGWDVSSPYARTLGAYFPIASVGHTGFTGTAIWMDPATRTYLVVLTNRGHPDGRGQVDELRRRVAAIVGAQWFGGVAAPPVASPSPLPAAAPARRPRMATRTGLDQLIARGFAPLQGRSVGLVTNHSGIDAVGRRGLDLLAQAPGVTLRAIFTPEHGLTGEIDAPVPHGRDPGTGLPTWSLYGPARGPTPAMLAGIDTLVFDVQDLGVRYYTYLATLVSVLDAAARARMPVVVLDRPNPLGGRIVEGPMGDADLQSFTAPHVLPVRTGLTIGEFARLVVAERRWPVDLTVIPLSGWTRATWFDETGLPWVNPSPNIRSLQGATLYAGIGLLESTNLSVGRGTPSPFELVGAPWVSDGAALAARLDAERLPGVSFVPVTFVPRANPYAHRRVTGVRLLVTDRESLRPVRVALALARALADLYPADFQAASLQSLLVNRATMWSVVRGEPLWRIASWGDAAVDEFLRRRQGYLLYP